MVTLGGGEGLAAVSVSSRLHLATSLIPLQELRIFCVSLCCLSTKNHTDGAHHFEPALCEGIPGVVLG